jgi:hypothetical protein
MEEPTTCYVIEEILEDVDVMATSAAGEFPMDAGHQNDQ